MIVLFCFCYDFKHSLRTRLLREEHRAKMLFTQKTTYTRHTYMQAKRQRKRKSSSHMQSLKAPYCCTCMVAVSILDRCRNTPHSHRVSRSFACSAATMYYSTSYCCCTMLRQRPQKMPANGEAQATLVLPLLDSTSAVTAPR